MTKAHLICALCSTGVLLCLPYCAVTFANADSGMMLCMLLLYAVNPAAAACLGAFAGRRMKAMWFWPMLYTLLFLFGAWAFLEWGQMDFLIYASGYLLIGYTACFIAAIGNRRKEHE